MNHTNEESVKNLLKTILTRLQNDKAITFFAESRQALIDDFDNEFAPSVLSEKDIHYKTLEKLGHAREAIEDVPMALEITEDAQYKTAKRMVKEEIGENELRGLYFQKPIRKLAEEMTTYFMKTEHIDDVFESDEELTQKIVKIIQRFNPGNII